MKCKKKKNKQKKKKTQKKKKKKRISPKPSRRTNFHWAIKRADMSLTTYQNYANIREEKLGSLTGC